MANRNVHFVLHIPAHDYLNYYSGVAREVVTVASDGRKIRFPANILRPFVTQDGIHGEFMIEFDEANKFVAIHKV